MSWDLMEMPCLRCGKGPLGRRAVARLCPSCRAYARRHGGVPVIDFTYMIRHLRRITPEGCWEWLARISSEGYGTLRHEYVHRLAYAHANGPIPDGLQIDHLCRNRKCFNPDHLEAVTQRVNVLRGTSPAARAAASVTCIRGHAFDEANTYIVPSTGKRRCRKCSRDYYRDRLQLITNDQGGTR